MPASPAVPATTCHCEDPRRRVHGTLAAAVAVWRDFSGLVLGSELGPGLGSELGSEPEPGPELELEPEPELGLGPGPEQLEFGIGPGLGLGLGTELESELAGSLEGGSELGRGGARR